MEVSTERNNCFVAMLVLSFVFGLGALAADHGYAQVAAGDIVIGDLGTFQGQVLLLEKSTGKLSTVLGLPGGVGEVQAVPGSDDVVVTSGDRLLRLSLNQKTHTTIARLPATNA